MAVTVKITGDRKSLAFQVASFMAGRGHDLADTTKEFMFDILKKERHLSEFTKQLVEIFNRHLTERGNHEGKWPGISSSIRGHRALIRKLKTHPNARYGTLSIPSGNNPFFFSEVRAELNGTKVRVFRASKKGIAFEVSLRPSVIHPDWAYPAGRQKRTVGFDNTVFAIAHGEQIPARLIEPKRAKSRSSPKYRAMLAIGIGSPKEKGPISKDGVVFAERALVSGFDTANSGFRAPYFTLSSVEAAEAVTEAFLKFQK